MKKIMMTLLCCGLITSCSPVKLPDVSNYKLTSLHNYDIPNYAKTNKVIYVIQPSANPGYQTSDMIYMASPFKLSSFAMSQWIAPPAQMLQPIVIHAIRAKGYFKAVLTAPSSTEVNYRLELQLIELQQEFLTVTSKVRMVVQATIVNNISNEVISSRRFAELIPANANDPYSGVLAANQATTKIAGRIATFTVLSVEK